MMIWKARAQWQKDGNDPDYRFSLANERTFLAWIRTSLATLAGGVLFHQFATQMQPAWLNLALSLTLIAVSAAIAFGAYMHWKGNELAMRHGRTLPGSKLLQLTTGATVAIAVGAAIIVGLQ